MNKISTIWGWEVKSVPNQLQVFDSLPQAPQFKMVHQTNKQANKQNVKKCSPRRSIETLDLRPYTRMFWHVT